MLRGKSRPHGLSGKRGLIEILNAEGIEVRDHGDRERWRWRPDREHRRAQNVAKIIEIVRDTTRRVSDAAVAEEFTLVLGGDCTVGIGTVAGHVSVSDRVGLIYFDTHADLNVPASVSEGALDWMGLAHMLAQDGAVSELVSVGPRVPLLGPERVLLFAWGRAQATPFEHDLIDRLGIQIIAVDDVAADPEGAADQALQQLIESCERLLLHFDVDVIDFTDTPLSENWGRNEGLAYETAARALSRLLASPSVSGLTITEVNPDHIEEGADSIKRLARTIAHGLAHP